MDEAPEKTIINVQFNIPRFIVGTQGKQNRACTGDMRITPGVSEPLEFQYVNADGVPINLAGYTLRLWFWYPQKQYESLSSNMLGNMILAKDLHIDDPYKGTATTVLDDQETLQLAQGGHSTIRWSLFVITPEGDVFPSQITSAGERFGPCRLDMSDIPNAETIKSATVSRGKPPLPLFVTLRGVGATAQVGTLTETIT
jgi:hypothetical protein